MALVYFRVRKICNAVIFLELIVLQKPGRVLTAKFKSLLSSRVVGEKYEKSTQSKSTTLSYALERSKVKDRRDLLACIQQPSVA